MGGPTCAYALFKALRGRKRGSGRHQKTEVRPSSEDRLPGGLLGHSSGPVLGTRQLGREHRGCGPWSLRFSHLAAWELRADVLEQLCTGPFPLQSAL